MSDEATLGAEAAETPAPRWGYRKALPEDPQVLGLPDGIYGRIFEDGEIGEGFVPLDALDRDGDGDVDAADLKAKRTRK